MLDLARRITFATRRNVRHLEDCYFYHTFDLPGIGLVEGQWDLRGRFDDYIGGFDLRNKTVLDIGTGNGFLTFEAETRGAREVVSFDIDDAKHHHFLPFKDSLYCTDHPRWRAEMNAQYELWRNGYWLAHRLFHSRANAFYGDIYELPTELGLFDVSIIGSVLEHLRDPISAMAAVARLTRSTMIITTNLSESQEATASLMGSADQPERGYIWWEYSLGTYREVLKMMGFRIAAVTKAMYKCILHRTEGCRHTIIAARE